MKIKSFIRREGKYYIIFDDGREREIAQKQLSKQDRLYFETMDDYIQPIEAKVVDIDDNLKNWTKNKLNTIEQHLLDIKTHLGI